MPHADEIIECKNCGKVYCAVCKERCPRCGTEDIVDEKMKRMREKRRALMNHHKQHYEKENRIQTTKRKNIHK